jgi:hypothetical protein
MVLYFAIATTRCRHFSVNSCGTTREYGRGQAYAGRSKVEHSADNGREKDELRHHYRAPPVALNRTRESCDPNGLLWRARE